MELVGSMGARVLKILQTFCMGFVKVSAAGKLPIRRCDEEKITKRKRNRLRLARPAGFLLLTHVKS